MSSTRIRYGAIIVLVALAGVMAGCSQGSDGSDGYDTGAYNDAMAGAPAPEAPPPVADQAYPGEESYEEAGYTMDQAVAAETANANAPAAGDATQAQIITVGDLSLRAEDPNDILESAKQIAAAAQGTVSAAELRAEGDGEYSYASATFRLPPLAFDQAVEDIKALAEVVDWRQSATDVTSQVIDLDARISGLRASIERLEAMMSEATSTSALLEAEGMLTQRQGELNSLLSPRAYFADQVGMSTLNLTVSPTPIKVTPTRTGAAASLRSGWDSLMAFGAGLVERAAFLFPWLIALGLVTGLIVALVRVSSRRTRPRRQGAGTAQTPPTDAAPTGAAPPGDGAPSADAAGPADTTPPDGTAPPRP
ncbi:MAG: DUF4349 domain-containing protein [Bifidobacteriaceae bacterium]|jgi:uncharacterized small protein (DUF1192 family)|nr:DUF4349 domain-containing protein [Bifidobacteriaceae bacterium]